MMDFMKQVMEDELKLQIEIKMLYQNRRLES